MLWTPVISGLEVDDLTAVRVLDAATWRERRDRLGFLGLRARVRGVELIFAIVYAP
jgi:hypothetical protein